MQGRVRLQPEVANCCGTLWNADTIRCAARGTPRCPPRQPAGGWFGRFQPRARLTRGLKTEAGALSFVRLTARSVV